MGALARVPYDGVRRLSYRAMSREHPRGSGKRARRCPLHRSVVPVRVMHHVIKCTKVRLR